MEGGAEGAEKSPAGNARSLGASKCFATEVKREAAGGGWAWYAEGAGCA